MDNKYLAQIEASLDRHLPKSESVDKVLSDSMRYSVMAPGKRVRPTLLLAFCDALGGNVENALPYACAVEFIHTYSLIHDDLPCMDNDDLRRGRPSNHIAFGEGNALLAGDALQALAFEVMLSDDALEKNGIAGAKAAGILAAQAGFSGMVGGQVIDTETEGKAPSLDVIGEMYDKKTGALIRASCMMGAVLAGADDSVLQKVRTYADNVGFVFQIVDDILDIESDTETLGKPVGSDEENNKVNYVTMLGIEESRTLADKMTSEACAALDQLAIKSGFLREFAHKLGTRTT
ncbi:MAG: polyprenyl synthetase family protein [Clostridia bacterium]|nr:polyprenyl synthetase family protein [Clostridia bacterium]